MCSPGINGKGELRGQQANPGSPEKWPLKVKTECVCVWYVCSCNTISKIVCETGQALTETSTQCIRFLVVTDYVL